jgi:pyruvate kinase
MYYTGYMENTTQHLNHTKIVCTIGPATWDEEVMRQIIDAGMDVARINGAFADRAEMLKVEELVRKFSNDVSMMIDVKGPEVRMNKFAEPIQLEADTVLEFGSSDQFPIYPANYPDTYQKMTVGQKIKVGDGDVELEVIELKEKSFMVKVNYGNELKPGKALNFPGLRLNDNPLTDKDMDLLAYAKERNWEFVSASFIRTKNDAQIVKDFLKDSKIEIIAKIEDAEGIENIDEILEVVDGVMVARGGLGVEMGLEKVPMAQRAIISAAIKAAKPVITATQMLDSMERNPLPTRAEANDVATAILLGSDAIMLSGESTAGKHPIEAVKFMYLMDSGLSEAIKPELTKATADYLDKKAVAFSKAIFAVTSTLEDIKAIVMVTDNLINVSLVARNNLKQPIIVMINNEVRKRQALLRKGVQEAISLEEGFMFNDRDEAINHIKGKLVGNQTLQPGDKYLLVVDLFHKKADFPKVFEIVTAQ